MSESNNYGVSLGLEFTSFDTINKEYQTMLKRLSGAGQIKVGVNFDKSKLLSIVDDFKQVTNQKITIDTSGSMTQVKTLKNSANELITIINKFNSSKELISTSYIASSSAKLEAQVGVYKQLTQLQANEFSLKKQMITAEGGHYEELNKQLQLNKQLMAVAGKALNNNKLTDEKSNNDLLLKRNELQNKYNANASKVSNNNNQSQINTEIKVSEQYYAKLKQINAEKLKMTQTTNVAKSDGYLNNSTYTNLQNQISKINVNTTKEKIDDLNNSITNLGKSSDRVFKLTNEIDKFKSKVNEIKANSSDSLGLGSNNAKLKEFENNLKSSEAMVNKLKKNSQSVSPTKFNENSINLGSSFKDLENGIGEIDAVKKDLLSLQNVITGFGNNKLYSSGFITKLQTELDSLNTTTSINKIDKFKEKVKSLGGSNENGVVKLEKSVNDFGNKIDSLTGKYKKLVPEAELSKFNSLLDNLRVKLESVKNGEVIDSKKISSEVNEVKNSFDKLNNSTKQSASAFRESNKDVMSFGDSLKNTATNMGLYLSSAVIFTKLFQELKNATEYIKVIDKSTTNMKMITGQSSSEIASTVEQFKKLGAEMHTTNAEVMVGGEELLRAGYNAKEAKDMMSASLLGSKVSGQDTKVVTEQLITMKNSFGLTSDSMEHYIDVISKMDNTSATSFAEISKSIQYTAFSAQQAGTPLETLIAYITTVSEKTRRAPETIGESFKTIYARYSNIKLGNLDEDGKSINDVEKALARVDIKIRDSKDSFRNFDTVLQEFMQKYKSGAMSQVDYLAGVQALSGVR